MLRSDWLSYYQAICSLLVASERRALLGGKKLGLKSSFNQLIFFFILDIFDQLVGFYITKTIILTQSPFGLEE